MACRLNKNENSYTKKDGSGYHKLTNVGLDVGDRVYPLVLGWSDGQVYYVMSINTKEYMTGFPDHPHIILDLNHSDTKSHEIETDRGYGPREKYFKFEPQ